jgi:uncharacterized protein YukE
MKKLSKEQLTKREELIAEMRKRHEAVQAAVADLNVTIQEANELITEVHNDQEVYFDERSEKWQEGDAGSAYSDWMSEWESEIEEIEAPEEDFIESFESLSAEVSS